MKIMHMCADDNAVMSGLYVLRWDGSNQPQSPLHVRIHSVIFLQHFQASIVDDG